MRKECEICQPEILDFKQNPFFYGSERCWGLLSKSGAILLHWICLDVFSCQEIG